MRIAQEINFQYTDMRQATTNLTDSPIAIHAYYAKTIRNPIASRTMLGIATVMMITTVNMTKIRYTAIATAQAAIDNQRH